MKLYATGYVMPLQINLSTVCLSCAQVEDLLQQNQALQSTLDSQAESFQVEKSRMLAAHDEMTSAKQGEVRQTEYACTHVAKLTVYRSMTLNVRMETWCVSFKQIRNKR